MTILWCLGSETFMLGMGNVNTEGGETFMPGAGNVNRDEVVDPVTGSTPGC